MTFNMYQVFNFDPRSGARTAGPTGYMVSSAADMAKWVHFLLSGGQDEHGNQVVSADDIARIFRSENIGLDVPFLQPDPPKIQYSFFDGYALGWMLGYYRGMAIS